MLSASKSYKCFHDLPVPTNDARFMPSAEEQQLQGRWLVVMKRKCISSNISSTGSSSDESNSSGQSCSSRSMSVLFSCDSQYFDPAIFGTELATAAPDLPPSMLDAMATQNMEHCQQSTLGNNTSSNSNSSNNGEGGFKPLVFGRIIKSSSFHGLRTAVVGEAAHAVTSALGQGCNCGLGSVEALAQALDAAGVRGGMAAGNTRGGFVVVVVVVVAVVVGNGGDSDKEGGFGYECDSCG